MSFEGRKGDQMPELLIEESATIPIWFHLTTYRLTKDERDER